MKIIAKGETLTIDGKVYKELTSEEKQNLWLRCGDYMRTHYDEKACHVIATVVPCYLGEWEEGKGHSIEI